jgi:hypothetical protein
MADRFWVGGSGTWDTTNTTNWSATTGGAGGASVPGTADSVVFDANSGTGFTVTVATGYNPSVVSVAGGTATVTLNLNDQTLTAQTFTFSGAPTGVVRTLAWGTSGQIIITGFNTTVFTTQTDNNLTCTGSRNVVFTYSGSTGTRQIGTPPITNIATNSLNYFIQGGTDTVTMQGASGITVRNLDLTGFGGTFTTNQMFAYGNVTLSAGMTLTAVPTTWNFRGPSGGTQTLTSAGLTLPVGITIATVSNTGTVLLADNLTIDSSRTLTLTGGTLNLNNRTANIGLFSSNGSNVRSIAFGNTFGQINVTTRIGAAWNGATATNFSYTGTGQVNFTSSAAAGLFGTRTITHGSSAGGSFATKAPPMYIYNGVENDAAAVEGQFTDIVFAPFTTNNVRLSVGTRTIYGNLILAPTQTLNGGASITTFAGSSTQTFDSAGSTSNFPITVGNGTSTGTVTLANAVTTGSARAITLTSGTLDLQGFALSTGSFVTSGSNVRAINMSNATLDLTGTGIVFTAAISTNLTLITANSTVLLSDDTTAARIFVTGNQTYNNVIIGGNTATSNTTFTGNATFNTLSSTKTVPHTVRFTAGSTTTMENFTVTGTAGNIVTITSDTANQHNLVYTGGGTVNTVDYLDISYSNASPAVDTWYPGVNSINSGNNAGWMFPVPASSSNFFLLF